MKASNAAPTRRRTFRTATAKKTVSATINYAALRWLKQRMKKPAPNDEAFWREFDRELNSNRLNLRKPT
jgi:hypothetical protein